MTEALLVQIITLLCSGSVTTSGEWGSKSFKESKEDRIVCYERLTNCSVGPNGVIMSKKDFDTKCVKEKK